MADNQNIVETIKEKYPNFCCKNCTWAKNPQQSLFNKTVYHCFSQGHIVTEDEFCSGFISRDEEPASQSEQPL